MTNTNKYNAMSHPMHRQLFAKSDSKLFYAQYTIKFQVEVYGFLRDMPHL